MWLFHLHSAVKRHPFSQDFPLTESIAKAFFRLFLWNFKEKSINPFLGRVVIFLYITIWNNWKIIFLWFKGLFAVMPFPPPCQADGKGRKASLSSLPYAAFDEGCVIEKGWCLFLWRSKWITNKMLQPWSPPRGNLEKRLYFHHTVEMKQPRTTTGPSK